MVIAARPRLVADGILRAGRRGASVGPPLRRDPCQQALVGC